MSEKINAYCSICDKGYYKCLSCKDNMKLRPWQLYTCSSEHYKIYQTLHGFNTRVYTKDEAKSKLKMIDLSDFDSLRDNIKNVINEIINEDKDIVEESVKDVATINLSNENDAFNKNIDDASNEDTGNDAVNLKSKMARKRKSFENIEANPFNVLDAVSSDNVETE